jgi:N6-adenosine-specific RNA methylase IME4
MWWVPTQPEEALAVMKAWGFRLVTMKGFTWHKTNRIKGNSAIVWGTSPGPNRRLLFAVRGRLPVRLDASICQHIAPRREHSAKPVVFREMLQRLVGDIPGLNYFARQTYLVGIVGEMNVTVVSG